MKNKKQKLIEGQYTLNKASFPLKYLWVLICVFIIMASIGYAAMNEELRISGEAVFRVEADIRVTDLKLVSATNGGIEDYNSRYGKSEIITGVTLPNLNSTVTYKITVTNFVDIIMLLEKINKINFNNTDIEYVLTDISVGSAVKGISTTTFQITFKYKSTVTNIPDNTNLDSNIQFVFTPVPLPVLAQITATEGQTKINTIDLTPTYTGGFADKLYYVAVDSSSGYVPANSESLIDFVLNGTDTNLLNSNYNTSPHIARGIVNINEGVNTYSLTGLEQNLASDAGLVGGVKYEIYACLVNSNIEGIVSNMEHLGYYQLAQGFDSGFGTQGNPYIIKSGVALSHMNYSEYNSNQSLYYQLQKNIDLSNYSAGEGWIPLGNTNTPFVGTFDGNGYFITNLTVNSDTATEVGLFGTSNGTIKNVGIESGNIKSTDSVATKAGGLVGYVNGGSIINCYSKASISNAMGADNLSGTGGLIGTISGGTSTTAIIIDSSYAACNVSGTQDVGGFIGDTQAGTYVDIDKCYATGSVTLTGGTGYQIGGFVGRTNANTTITNSYARSNVTSNGTGAIERIGGFAGWIQDSTSINYCYASGDVVSTNANISNANSGIGGFLGAATTTTAIKAWVRNCLSLNDTVTSNLNGKTGKFIGFDNAANPITLNKNYANSAMTTNGTAVTPSGVDAAPGPLPNASLLTVSFFTTATNWNATIWDTAIWNITDGVLPTLKVI